MSDFSIGLSGILGAQRALETISQNIANASTPGYARREVKFTAARGTLSGGVDTGGGVTADTIVRIKDMFLEGRVQTYQASLSRTDAQTRYYSEIEGLLQEPSDGGIGNVMDQFFSQWQQVATRPEDNTGRIMLSLTGENLSERIRTLRDNLVNLRSAVQQEIQDAVGQVNALTEQLAQNNQLVDQFAGAAAPLSIEDERDNLMQQLSNLLGAANVAPNDARARVMVGSLQIVSGPDNMEIVAPVDYDSSVMLKAFGGNIPVDITNGKIAGLLELNQKILPEIIGNLDRMASGIIESVNRLHAEGINGEGRFTQILSSFGVEDANGDGDPSNDLLAQGGLPFAPTAGTLTINVADASGAVTAHTLNIDPAKQTLGDLVNAISGIDHLSASSANGRLRIMSASGYSFDFSATQGTNLLAALGVNAFFAGKDASDIGLAANLVDHPELIAAGRSTDSGDGSNASAIGDLRQTAGSGTGGLSLPESWRSFVSDIGLTSASAKRSVSAMQGMVDLLNEQEQSISGVSLDEEAAKMMQFQQMYSASARYLAAVSKMTDTLLQYL